MRVVLIDDHALVRRGVRGVLESRGVTVLGDLAPHEGVLVEAGALCPDLLLLDPSMTQYDGLDLLRRWKARHPEIPVMVLSMNVDETTVGQAMQAGADGYVCKSSEPEDLWRAMAALGRGEKPLCPRTRPPRRGREPDLAQLTARELQVLVEVGRGATLSDLAAHFVVSRNTAKSHLHSLYRKLGVSDRAQVILKGREMGLLD